LSLNKPKPRPPKIDGRHTGRGTDPTCWPQRSSSQDPPSE